MKALNFIAVLLVVVGGLNWGLAVFNFNLVTMLLGEGTMLTNVVYALVGLSALYVAATVLPKQMQ